MATVAEMSTYLKHLDPVIRTEGSTTASSVCLTLSSCIQIYVS